MTWPVVPQKSSELQPFKKHFAECIMCNNFTPTNTDVCSRGCDGVTNTAIKESRCVTEERT
jgi:predicted nucleic acid-binding Zn ribbon protein